jgi:hypothetical protein
VLLPPPQPESTRAKRASHAKGCRTVSCYHAPPEKKLRKE